MKPGRARYIEDPLDVRKCLWPKGGWGGHSQTLLDAMREHIAPPKHPQRQGTALGAYEGAY